MRGFFARLTHFPWFIFIVVVVVVVVIFGLSVCYFRHVFRPLSHPDDDSAMVYPLRKIH